MPLIVPRLIHPMLITIAPVVIADGTQPDGKKTFDNKWRSPTPEKPLKWETDETKMITIRAQLKNSMFAYSSKTTGGWIRVSKCQFLCYQEDVINADGRYKFDKADRIVRLTDVALATKFPVSFQIRDILLRGQYDRVHFVELVCEKIAAEA